METIYLDHNATTPTRPEVVEAMADCGLAAYANPASQHRPGQQARRTLEEAREAIAEILDADLAPPRRDRLIFTSGGTEANNLAVLGIARAHAARSASRRGETPPHCNGGALQSGHDSTEKVQWVAAGRIIISAAEHQSVIEPAEHLLEQGWRLDTLGLTAEGVVRLDQLRRLLEGEGSWGGTHAGWDGSCTATPASSEGAGVQLPHQRPPQLVSVQLGNHETGVLQPIAELAAICNQAGVPLHTDAVQVAGKLPVSFRRLGVAAMSISAHKFQGPPGIGALLLRDGVPLAPLLFGGHQQEGLRPGTEPVALAIGMATALELWRKEQNEYARRLTALRDRFERGLRVALPDIIVHGASFPLEPVGQTFLSASAGSATSLVPGQTGMSAPPDPRSGDGSATAIPTSHKTLAERLPQTSNVAFPGHDGEMLRMALDLAGVACSVGAACSSGSTELSPTLRAMGLPNDLVKSSLRFSFGATTTEAEIDEAVRRIAHVCGELE